MSILKYDELVQKSLITVVKNVLEEVSKNGMPGTHHFYIRFRTDHPKVKIPKFLKERHPEEVMIVIQYQFWNLQVNTDSFCVELSFNGVPEKLFVPFAALTAFVDPSVKFALQFTPSIHETTIDPFNGKDSKPDEDKNDSSEKEDSDDATIISFDSFKKK